MEVDWGWQVKGGSDGARGEGEDALGQAVMGGRDAA